jgi:hypothetical protein
MTAQAPPVERPALRLVSRPALRVVKPRPNEPHFDDERAGGTEIADLDGAPPTAGALALALAIDPADDGSTPTLRLVTDSTRPGRSWGPLAPAVTPPTRAWVGRLLQAITEVLAGERALAQLSAHLSPSVYEGLDAAARPMTKPGGRPPAVPAVRSVRMCEPRPGVAEVAAVVRRGNRMAAIAMRLELRAERWRCVALQVG